MEHSKTALKAFRMLALLVSVSFLFACGPGEYKRTKLSQLENGTSSEVLAGSLLLKSITWSTSNGGIAYSISPVGNGASFSITVTRYAGASLNALVRLNGTDSVSNYQFVLNLFRGATSVSNNAQTAGTNNVVVLENYLGQSQGYTNPTAFGYSANPFTALNQYIASQI